MKRYLKIVILMLIVALLGALTVVAVSANSETDGNVRLYIKARNLSFSGSVHIVYAVEFEGVDESEVKMLFWTTPKSNKEDYTKDNAEKIATGYTDTVNGVVCRIFENDQLWAKNMTDTLYARAYAKVDGVEYYSEVERYSILEYAYNKLGITGTASSNENLKNLVSQLLVYGEKTQKYFKHNTESLPTDKFVKVEINGGLLPDGMSYGLYKVGTELEIRGFTDPDKPLILWTDNNGKFVGDSAVLHIVAGEENVIYTCKNSEVTGAVYELCDNGRGYEVVGYKGYDTEIVIDSGYKGLPVIGIANGAFRDRESLEKITLPDTIEYIGDYSFRGCKSLQNVDLPDSLRKIGIYAFAGCASFDSINIPAATEIIGDRAFISCTSVNSITVENGNGAYVSVDNCIVSTKEGSLILGCNGSSIPSDGSVLSIKSYAFTEVSGLTSIDIPTSCSTISSEAFYRCNNLKSVYIPATLKNLSAAAFYMCSGIESITASTAANAAYYAENNCLIRTGTSRIVMGCKTSVIPQDGSVTNISERAFEGCDITSVNIPASITIIADGAFRNCVKLISVNMVGEARLKIIGQGAFAGCTVLRSINLPETLTEIGESAFSSTALTSVVIPSKVETIGAAAFMDCKSITSLTIESVVLSRIDSFIFAGCENLSDFNIPSDCVIKNIPAFALANCSPLEALHIPKKVNSINESAFVGCDSIKEITASLANNSYFVEGNCLIDRNNSTIILGCENSVIPETDSVTAIGDNAFSNKNVVTVVIPDGVTYIGNKAFKGCTVLTSVSLPNTLDHVGNDAFEGCTALITVENNGAEYLGNEKNPYILLLNGTDPLADSIVVNKDCEFIHSDAFNGYSSLNSVTLPEGLLGIGRYAFLGCENIEQVTIDGNMIYWAVIDMSEPFSNPLCYSGSLYSNGEEYEGIIASGNQTEIFNHSLFWSKSYGGCRYVGNLNNPYAILVRATTRGIDTYEIHPDTKIIFSEAFRNCSAMTNISIPDSVLVIAEDVFQGCESLATVNIGSSSSLATIGNRAFEGLKNLSSLYIPSSLIYLGDDAFAGCESLEAITITEGNSIGYVGARVFMGNDSISFVDLPEATYIGEKAFMGSSVTGVYAPKVGTIGQDAFLDCTSLKTFSTSESSEIKSVGDRAFRNTAIEEINLAKTAYIGAEAFYDCKSLVTIDIPSESEALKTVGDRAFYNCASLTAINYGAANSIGVEILYGAKALKTMIIPFVGDGEANPFFAYVFGATTYKDGYVLVEKIDANGNPIYENGAIKLEDNTNYELLPRTLESIVIRGGDYIADNAFYGVLNGGEKNASTINKDVAKTSIIIPASVESIGNNAFYQCRGNLASVTFEEGSQLKIIKSGAFCNCFALTYLNLPYGLESIEGNAIRNTALTTLTVPSTVTYIGRLGLRTNSLKTVYFEDPTGWYRNGVEQDAESLKDPSSAASICKNESDSKSYEWTKEAK